MRRLVMLLAAAACVFILSAVISGVVHACGRWHDDGVALWCCPERAGACVLVGFVGEGVGA